MSKPIEKLVVATELLDRALRMYYEGNSYFAALHLAGGAEEVLGAYVERHGGESSFRNLQQSAVTLSKLFNGDVESEPKEIAHVMNRAKNSTKHMNSGGDDDQVDFNARAEAHVLLDRAVSNYYTLMNFYKLPETELVRRFNLELVGRGA